MDSLREKSFSSSDSFFEPEQPKTSRRRILLLVALLAALGVAGWWTYTNYLAAMESRKPEAAASNAGEASAEKPSTKAAAKDAVPAVDAGGSQAAGPTEGTPQSHAEKASAAPELPRKTADAAAKPAAKPVTPRVTPKIALGDKSAEKRAPRVTSAKTSKLPEPAAADSGAADFRKGEAYLYGRGAPKNCDQAVKYLKTASSKSSAKARSTFGSMYATGHCVPRDLPTSYSWFALALRADPNNQILERDLSAIWKQMTPPERQMATRMKQ
jgi:TPR repeat protein